MTDFVDIGRTIDEYAETVVGGAKSNIGGPLRCSQFDDSVSMRSYSSSAQMTRTRGSKAVLSALRALQSKIAAMKREHAECLEKHDERVNGLKHENSRMKSQIKQIVKLNQSLTAKLKASATTEQRALRSNDAADSRLMALQKEVDRLQTASADHEQLNHAVILYAEQLERAKTNLSILKDEVRRQRLLRESVAAQKLKSDDFGAEMVAENERLHSKLLLLQKSKMKIESESKSKTKLKLKRSKSVHSMKRSAASKRKRRPFVPSGGNLNVSFSSFDRRNSTSTASSTAASRSKRRERARSRKTTKVKPLPMSSLRVHERRCGRSKRGRIKVDRQRIADLVHIDATDSVFDGIDIDYVLN